MSGFDPAKFMDYASRPSAGHGAAVGIAYHAHGEDWVELALPWRPELVGIAGTGILASGPTRKSATRRAASGRERSRACLRRGG